MISFGIMDLGYPLDFSHATDSPADKFGFSFSHPASFYLAAAHSHPAMALAAMANTAAAAPGTTTPSASDVIFTKTHNMNNFFSANPVMNNLAIVSVVV